MLSKCQTKCNLFRGAVTSIFLLSLIRWWSFEVSSLHQFALRHQLDGSPSPVSISSLSLEQPRLAKGEKHKLCAITRVNNVPRSLVEWLEYHSLLGVGHFYIADDCSKDEGRTQQVLDIYSKAGLITAYGEAELNNNCSSHKANEQKVLNFLFQQARDENICEWIGAFDVDEYITIQRDIEPSGDLASILDATPLPVYRLAWIQMGSNGLVDKPPGIMIEHFTCGQYPEFFEKVLAKPEVIHEWTNPHFPHINKTSDAHPDLPAYSKTLTEYTERAWFADEEMRHHSVDGQDYKGPAPAMFIKHYYYRSYEEFMTHRGNRLYNAMGNSEDFIKKDPRSYWLRGNYPTCLDYSNDFTRSMIAPTKQSLAEREIVWNQVYGDVGVFPQVNDWLIRY